MTKTVRILNFERYADMIADVRDHTDDDPHFVVGTHAPRRDWGDQVADWVSMAGFSGVRDFALKHDHGVGAYTEDDRRVDVDVPEHVLEDTPTMYHDDPEITVDDGVKRIGDVAFPTFGFADETSTDELEQADTTLIGTTIFPGDAVRSAHPAVLEPDDLVATVDALADEHDPDEHAIVVGSWSPVGNVEIMADGPVCRSSDTIFPTTAFTDQTGISSVSKGNTAFYGTAIVARDALSDEANRLADGELESIEHPDQADDEQGVEA